MSGLDLVTGGLLGETSGLSLTTGGLLVLQETGPIIPGLPAGATPKIDVMLLFSGETLDGDVALLAGDLVPENSLRTALLLSLFCDARATDEQLERFGGADPRGWCLDAYAAVPRDEYGSRLWLLAREKQTPENLDRARELARACTLWMVQDGVVGSIEVAADYVQRSWLGIQLTLTRARAPRERFAFVWG